MDLTPRNNFNCQLAQRYTDIPTAIPQATHLNTPIGTRFCDGLGFICHPQKYPNYHQPKESYPHTQTESSLYNLDYYNPYDNPKRDDPCNIRTVAEPSLDDFFEKQDRNCLNTCNSETYPSVQLTPRLWNNNSKLHKFGQY